MSTISPLLRQTLQDLGENVDIWGSVLNVSALQVLEDAIAGTATATLLTTADYTLDPETAGGGPSEADSFRYMIINVAGTPGGATNVIAPATSKVYLVANNCGSSIVFKTSAGTGPTIPDGEAQWVYCDGTNIIATTAASATTAATATSATDADALVGVAGANYAQKGVAQTFTKGQLTQRKADLATTASSLTIDCSDSNAFYLLTTESFTLQAPTNATNGQMFSLAIQQGAGGPHSITFAANTFVSAGGASITLSTVAGDVDYLAFEYMTGLAAPFNTPTSNRWVVSQLKDLGAL